MLPFPLSWQKRCRGTGSGQACVAAASTHNALGQMAASSLVKPGHDERHGVATAPDGHAFRQLVLQPARPGLGAAQCLGRRRGQAPWRFARVFCRLEVQATRAAHRLIGPCRCQHHPRTAAAAQPPPPRILRCLADKLRKHRAASAARAASPSYSDLPSPTGTILPAGHAGQCFVACVSDRLLTTRNLMAWRQRCDARCLRGPLRGGSSPHTGSVSSA